MMEPRWSKSELSRLGAIGKPIGSQGVFLVVHHKYVFITEMAFIVERIEIFRYYGCAHSTTRSLIAFTPTFLPLTIFFHRNFHPVGS